MNPTSPRITLAIPLVLAALWTCPTAFGRSWTNDEGRTIEAEYLSSDGTSVTLRFQGQEVRYELARLSEADRKFVATRIEEEKEADPPAPTGWITDFPISTPAFPDVDGYLDSDNAKAVYRAFDDGAFPDTWGDRNKKDAEAEFAYENGSTIVYVPSSYDGSEPYGTYVHISSGDGGEHRREYAPVMDRLKMIYVSPKGTSNHQPMLRRVRLAVDAFASVRATWNTDPARSIVGGLSGGGHMGMLTHAMFPETFVASVSHAAQSYLPGNGTSGHFPGLTVDDLDSRDFKGHKWCVISGDKDFNYQEILDSSQIWEANDFDYRFFDIPGMDHVNAAPGDLETALKWIEP